jgi:menaquinone-specific isochorismate synthase
VRLTVPAVDPLALFDATADDAVLFAPGGGDFELGLGVAALVEAQGPARFALLRDGARDLFADLAAVGGAEPRLLGGLAFAAGDGNPDLPDALMVLPRWTVRGVDGQYFLDVVVGRCDDLESAVVAGLERCALGAQARGSASRPAARVVRVEGPSFDGWAADLAAIRREIETGGLRKLVAARATEVELDGTPTVGAILRNLEAPTLTRFALRRGGATFFGATPERLVAVCGRRVRTEALAGSAALGPARTMRLLRDPKERAEHQFVVDAIVAALAPIASRLEVPAAPSVRELPTLQHLHTPIEVETHASWHVLDIAARLHPTPAVSGFPAARAAELMPTLGGDPRGWYCGPFGAIGADGSGELVVALRSALSRGNSVTIYAGAGIVAASDPFREHAELGLKTRGMLRALGAPGASPELLNTKPDRSPAVHETTTH